MQGHYPNARERGRGHVVRLSCLDFREAAATHLRQKTVSEAMAALQTCRSLTAEKPESPDRSFHGIGFGGNRCRDTMAKWHASLLEKRKWIF